MVQKDLSEFYQTIQTDTAHVVADTATKVQDQIKVAIYCDVEFFQSNLVKIPTIIGQPPIKGTPIKINNLLNSHYWWCDRFLTPLQMGMVKILSLTC